MEKIVKNKRPPGRPKTDNPATKTLASVRVTPKDLDKYKKAAAKSGKTFSAWVRSTLDRVSTK